LVVQRFPAHSRKLADFVIKPDRSPVWLEYLEARDKPLWGIGLRWVGWPAVQSRREMFEPASRDIAMDAASRETLVSEPG
jgi:hypothetical protein